MARPGQTCAKCGIRTDKTSHSRGLSKGLRTLAEQAGLLGFPTAKRICGSCRKELNSLPASLQKDGQTDTATDPDASTGHPLSLLGQPTAQPSASEQAEAKAASSGDRYWASQQPSWLESVLKFSATSGIAQLAQQQDSLEQAVTQKCCC